MSRQGKRALWRRDDPLLPDEGRAPATAVSDVVFPSQSAPSHREETSAPPAVALPTRTRDASRPRVQGLAATLELRRQQVNAGTPTPAPVEPDDDALRIPADVLGQLADVLSRTTNALGDTSTGFICTSAGTPLVHLGMDEAKARRLAASTSTIHAVVEADDGAINVMVMSLENGETHAGAAAGTGTPRLLHCVGAKDTGIGVVLHTVQRGVKEITALLSSRAE